jgi:hypothetical protein
VPERPPDPFRPREIPRGRPFAVLGRPGFAVAIMVLVVGAIVAVILVLALR